MAEDQTMQASTLGTEHAATQPPRSTLVRAARRPLWTQSPVWLFSRATPDGATEAMTSPKPREFFIQGVTLDGHAFRPSDWAERLAGAMSCFRPDGVHGGIGAFIGYSPLCVPRLINGVKCVIVNEALLGVEPMAWDFVMNFARDNQLQLTEACLIEPPKAA
jgi:Protein of unknown function (DUF3579)